MVESPSFVTENEKVSRQFDSYIRKNLKGEARNYTASLLKRAQKEILFSEMNELELSKLYSFDEYDSDFTNFCTAGFDI